MRRRRRWLCVPEWLVDQIEQTLGANNRPAVLDSVRVPLSQRKVRMLRIQSFIPEIVKRNG